MKISTSIASVLLAAGLVLPPATAETAEAPVRLKLANTQPQTTPLGKAIIKWVDEVEKRTNGAVKIDVFWSSQLGSSPAQIEQTMLGAIDINIDDITFYEKYSPRVAVVNVPYLFRDTKHFQKFLKSDLFDVVRTDIEKKGGKILNTEYNWFRGPYRTILATRPIKTPDDLKGLKLRMFESSTVRGAWEYLGANTVVITWAEVYLALKQGVVDAVTAPVSMIYPMKFTEVAKHVTRTNEYPQNIIVLANKKRFESLPGDVQKTMVEVTDEVGDSYTDIVNSVVAEDLAKIKKEHGASYYEPNLTPWQEKAQGFLTKLEADGVIEPGLLDEINALK